jgi:hypothetical protein
VDGTYNENEQIILKEQARKKINTKEEERDKLHGEKRTMVEVSKPAID